MTALRFYSFINNATFRMPISIVDSVQEVVECSHSGTSCTSLPESRIFEVKIDINNSEFIEPISNEAFCQSLINWVKAIKLKHIYTLSKEFKINLVYKLTDQAGRVISEGATASLADVDDIVLLYGNTDKQELGYRRGFTFDHTFKFSNAFSSNFGIMKKPTNCCTLKIESLQILGRLESDSFYHYMNNAHKSVLDNTGRHPYHYPCYDSIANTLVLFDTKHYGIEFDPVHIDFSPRELRVKVHTILNNFAAFDDDYDLLVALAENRNNASENPDEGSNNPDYGFIRPGCGCTGVTPPPSSGNLERPTPPPPKPPFGENIPPHHGNHHDACCHPGHGSGCKPITPPPDKEEIFPDNIVTDDEIEDLKNEIKSELTVEISENVTNDVTEDVKEEVKEDINTIYSALRVQTF